MARTSTKNHEMSAIAHAASIPPGLPKLIDGMLDATPTGRYLKM
jgi:hypothetical protein